MWYVLNAGVVGFITLIIGQIVAERMEQSQAEQIDECCGSGTCFICEGRPYWEENEYKPNK
jgi:hypothetical protein